MSQGLIVVGFVRIVKADCLLRLAQNATWRQKYSVAIPSLNAATLIYQNHTYLRGQARCMWLVGVISQARRLDYTEASEKVADAALAYRYLGDRYIALIFHLFDF